MRRGLAMAKGSIITFEEAMRSTRAECIERFGKHVNPAEASLLKLVDADKLYTNAEGTTLTDHEGKSYLDFTAGYGSLNLGHNPPEVLKAVREATALPAVLLAGYNPLMGALGSSLAAILPGELSVTAFGSGGAEAVELALKTAKASTKRKKFVSCCNGYHGISLGAMSVCGAQKYGEILGPLMDHCETVPFGDLSALEQKLKGQDVAAFIVEPVQGEGGAVAPPLGYLKEAEQLCHKYGSLLILDEIQTGFGRTGKMFAMEHEGVVPDIVTLSKSLGSGVVPISVSVTTEEIWKRGFGGRDRFDLVISTFGGNPAACAAALKTIEIMRRDDIPAKAAELGDYARKSLERLMSEQKLAKEVPGQGLLLGVGIDAPKVPGDENVAAMVLNRLLNKHGILTSLYDLAPSIIRFEPPLIVTRAEIDEAVQALDESLSKGTLGLTMGFAKSVIGRKVRRP